MGIGGWSGDRLSRPPHWDMPWKMYKPADLEDAWIDGAPNGKCRSVRMSFEGDVFYSYTTVIARRIKHEGKVAYVIDLETFSVTTTAHQWGLLRTLERRGCRIFRVYMGDRNQTLLASAKGLRDYYAAKFDDKPQGRQRAAREQKFLHGVEQIRNAIEVCEFFGLATKRLKKVLTYHAQRIREAEWFLGRREEQLKQRREARWEKRRLQALAVHEAAVAAAIVQAEKLVKKYTWQEPGEDEDLRFGGNEFYLLNSRPDLKMKLMDWSAKREIANLKKKNHELYMAKWDLEHAVGGTLEEIQARRAQVEQQHRKITFDDQ